MSLSMAARKEVEAKSAADELGEAEEGQDPPTDTMADTRSTVVALDLEEPEQDDKPAPPMVAAPTPEDDSTEEKV
jgi:hypothetical protein